MLTYQPHIKRNVECFLITSHFFSCLNPSSTPDQRAALSNLPVACSAARHAQPWFGRTAMPMRVPWPSHDVSVSISMPRAQSPTRVMVASLGSGRASAEPLSLVSYSDKHESSFAANFARLAWMMPWTTHGGITHDEKDEVQATTGLQR